VEEWQQLTHWTQGREYRVERVRLKAEGIAIEGDFAPPPLARLKTEDQVFAAAFLRAHGSIKQMEESYGLSYPTIKNRLRRISEELSFLDIQVQGATAALQAARPSRVGALLDRLETGEMKAKEVLDALAGPVSDGARKGEQA